MNKNLSALDKDTIAKVYNYNLQANASTPFIGTPSTKPFIVVVHSYNDRSLYIGGEWANQFRFNKIYGSIDIKINYSNYKVSFENTNNVSVSVCILT